MAGRNTNIASSQVKGSATRHPSASCRPCDPCDLTPSERARVFAGGVLSMMMFLLFNGVLYLSYDGIFDWSRDVSTAASICLALALLVVARRWPSRIRPRPITCATLAAGIAGYALSAAGLVSKSASAIVVGTVLVAPLDIWGLAVWLLALARMERRDACLLIAASGVVGIPLAGLVNGVGSYWLANLACAATACGVVLLSLPLTGDFFKHLQEAKPSSEQQIANPEAVLPLSHTFYVYIFIFSVAYGFALRCENDPSGTVLTLASLVASVAVGLYAWHAKAGTRVDSLFVASFVSVTVGFMLVLVDDVCTNQLAVALLMIGYICLQLLIWLALSSAARRNAAPGIPTSCWGTAASYVGIVVGAALWLVPNRLLAVQLGSDDLLQSTLVVALLAGLVLYTLLTRRGFVFDSAIEGIEPDAPAPQVEVRYVDSLGQRCEQACERYGLTAREADVMALLAHGNNAARIQEELGISYNTVKYHVRNVYAKMGVHSQQDLIDTLCA